MPYTALRFPGNTLYTARCMRPAAYAGCTGRACCSGGSTRPPQFGQYSYPSFSLCPQYLHSIFMPPVRRATVPFVPDFLFLKVFSPKRRIILQDIIYYAVHRRKPPVAAARRLHARTVESIPHACRAPAAYINRYKSAWQAGFRAARPASPAFPGFDWGSSFEKTPPRPKPGETGFFLGFVNRFDEYGTIKAETQTAQPKAGFCGEVDRTPAVRRTVRGAAATTAALHGRGRKAGKHIMAFTISSWSG